jgi:hypothetical protein
MIIYKVSKLPMYPAVQPSALHLQVTICCRVQLTYHTQKDIVSGDEIISDTWNLKEIDDVVYEVDCKSITKGAEDNIGQSPNQVHPSTIRIIPVNRLTPILDQILEPIPPQRKPRKVSRVPQKRSSMLWTPSD